LHDIPAFPIITSNSFEENMASENTIERILNRLNDSDEGVTTKTAAAATPSAEARMLETVRRISNAPAVKTASAAAPVSDLHSIAKEASDAEGAALVKQAQHMGAVLADSFMERFAQYDSALSAAGVKTAAVNPELVKQAASDGYRQAVVDMEKQAEEEYQKGYSDQLRAIHKTAADIHYAGQQMAHAVVERVAAQTK
jgi:hypothetical protein